MNMEISSEDLNPKNKNSLEPIDNFYKILTEVGKGTFGTVYKALELSNGRIVAIKKIALKQNQENNSILKEIELMKEIEHPNIVKYYNYFKNENDNIYYIIMEYLEGGTLKNYLTENKNNITENESRIIIKQLLEALNYLHYKRDICHRDIKPENIMFSKNDKNNLLIKLVDFGLSSDYFESKNILENCGTLIYMAPEQISKNIYSKAVDIWSVGIILYMLLNKGKHPFYFLGQHKNKTIENISKKEIEFNDNDNSISPIAKHFLYKLLDKNPSYRYTARMALNHPWITLKKFDNIPMTIYDKAIFDENVQKLNLLMLTSYFMLNYKKNNLRRKIKNNILFQLSCSKKKFKNKEENNKSQIFDDCPNLENYEKSVTKTNEIYRKKFRRHRESMFLPKSNSVEKCRFFIGKFIFNKENNNSNQDNSSTNDSKEEENEASPTSIGCPISPQPRSIPKIFTKNFNKKIKMTPLKLKSKLSNNNLLSKVSSTPDIHFLKNDKKKDSSLNNFIFSLELKDEDGKNPKSKRISKFSKFRKINSLPKSISSRIINNINKSLKGNDSISILGKIKHFQINGVKYSLINNFSNMKSQKLCNENSLLNDIILCKVNYKNNSLLSNVISENFHLKKLIHKNINKLPPIEK